MEAVQRIDQNLDMAGLGPGGQISPESPWLTRPGRPEGTGSVEGEYALDFLARPGGEQALALAGSANPTDMSPNARIADVATIMATGFLRLKRCTPCMPTTRGAPEDSAKIIQELPGASASFTAPCAHRLTPREKESAGEETEP